MEGREESGRGKFPFGSWARGDFEDGKGCEQYTCSAVGS